MMSYLINIHEVLTDLLEREFFKKIIFYHSYQFYHILSPIILNFFKKNEKN